MTIGIDVIPQFSDPFPKDLYHVISTTRSDFSSRYPFSLSAENQTRSSIISFEPYSFFTDTTNNRADRSVDPIDTIKTLELV